ncbi:unnamed protein product, partial [Amoebophrya sp. A25]|eukprot:GSA25T00024555001.1
MCRLSSGRFYLARLLLGEDTLALLSSWNDRLQLVESLLVDSLQSRLLRTRRTFLPVERFPRHQQHHSEHKKHNH